MTRISDIVNLRKHRFFYLLFVFNIKVPEVSMYHESEQSRTFLSMAEDEEWHRKIRGNVSIRVCSQGTSAFNSILVP